jgi:hypothetical protein
MRKMFALPQWKLSSTRKPDATKVSPVALLAYFMHSFIVASGMSLATFQCLLELETTESVEVVQAVLESGQGSNAQFEAWVALLRDTNRQAILRKVDLAKLSKARRKVIDGVFREESSSTA